MAVSYTFDVFSSLDGFGAHNGNWGKQGPELLAHRFALFEKEQRMVFGAKHLSGAREDAVLEHRRVSGL